MIVWKRKLICLREVILKKKKNAILKSQLEQYEKILEEVSKGKGEDDSSLLQELQNKSGDKKAGGFDQTNKNFRITNMSQEEG